MKPKTNFTNEVLKHLRKGKTLTVNQAAEKWGSYKLSTRISEWIEKGYVFEKKWCKGKNRFGNPCEFYRYKLLKEPQ